MQLQMRWLVCHYLMGLMIASSILVRMRCFADKFIKTFVNILFRFFFLELHIFAIFVVCLQFLVCLFWDLSTRILSVFSCLQNHWVLLTTYVRAPHFLVKPGDLLALNEILCFGTCSSFYLYWSQAWVMEDWVRQGVDCRLIWNRLRKCFLSQMGF